MERKTNRRFSMRLWRSRLIVLGMAIFGPLMLLYAILKKSEAG